MFGPEKVYWALRRVQEQHPYTEQGTVHPSPRADGDAAALWKRLAALSGEALDSELRTLGRREERLILYGAPARLIEPESWAVLARAFEVRGIEGADHLAWDVFLISGFDECRPAAERFVAEHPERRAWPALLAATRPVHAAHRLVEQSELPLERWLQLPEVGLATKPLFIHQLQLAALFRKSLPRTSRRESTATLLQWARERLVEDDRVEWYRDYLEVTHVMDWPRENAILSDIIGRFLEPRADRPFWSGVSPAARRAVEQWLIDAALTNLLQEGRRVRFWRRYLNRMTRKPEQSRAKDAVFIFFDGWFAVQFREEGKATYLLPEKFSDVRRRYASDLYRDILDARGDERVRKYEHRGHYWEAGAQAEVNAVIALYEGTA